MGILVCKTFLVFMCSSLTCFIVSAFPSEFINKSEQNQPSTQQLNSDNQTISESELTKRILKGFNMDRIPNMLEVNISQAEYERGHEEYFNLVEQNQRQRLANKYKSNRRIEEHLVKKKLYRFQHTHTELEDDNRGIENRIISFNVNIPEEVNKEVEIEEAQVRLMAVPQECTDSIQTFTVEALHHDSEAVKHINTDRYSIRTCLGRWVSVDVTNAVQYSKPSVLKIQLTCKDCHQLQLVNPNLNIIVSVKNKKNSRTRRADNKKNIKRRYTERCRRYPLEVTLKDLKGFDYIVQPTTFDAGFCAGRCPPRWNVANQHTLIQNLIYAQNKTAVPKPCCAPKELKKLEFLYADPDEPTKLLTSEWNDTIIISCACS